MKKYFPVWIPVAVIVALSLINGIADYWHLYYLIWWLDIPMHVFGGFWVAISMLLIYFRSQTIRSKEYSALFVLLLAVASALTIGLFWEVYEYAVDRVVAAFGDKLGDTLKDLLDDLAGALIATWVFLRGGYNQQR